MILGIEIRRNNRKFWIEMKATEKFWTHIGNALKEEFGSHPKNWKPKQVEDFLFNRMLDRLNMLSQKNKKVKKILGLGENGKISKKIPSKDTFRRIFKTEGYESSLATRNVFAIYFKYTSYDTYLSDYDIKDD